MENNKEVLLNGDCLDILKEIPDNCVDSLITDPPAGISFMGKDWDGNKGGSKQWIVWMSEVMKECLRVLKPGAYGLVWAIPRTSHWTATALEDAGFEIRDVITHLFGSGFPKSLDISKAIDKSAGANREVIGDGQVFGKGFLGNKSRVEQGYRPTELNPEDGVAQLTTPATTEAKQWQGWGTALKPASEHWILVRKPCSEKTVAANVLKHGTGGINIDASRIGLSADDNIFAKNPSTKDGFGHGDASVYRHSEGAPAYNPSQGRFPANLVLSHNEDCATECTPGCAVAELDRQSGELKGPWGKNSKQHVGKDGETSMFKLGGVNSQNELRGQESGGASRFFYCAKASKREKGEGNIHPTVKATKLMSYLITMITPNNGIVLDPFMGSGSTGVSAIKLGYRFIGIEKESDYFEISKKRIKTIT